MKVIQLNDEELKQVNDIQIAMLDEVDRICRKYKIKYMICGGTLLGAVRHKGFIPWDDDVDIRMDRIEYEKFCKVCQKELDSDKYFFQTHKTDKNYPWFFGKIRYNYSRYVRVGQEHLKMNDGIFIDIFPTDGLPNNIIHRKIVLAYCHILKKMLYSVVGCKNEKNYIKRVGYILLNMVPKSLVYDLFETMAKKYSNRKYKYEADYSFPASLMCRENIQRKWLENLVEVEFEGKYYYTTYAIDEWLTIGYGDYMQLPPVEERHGHNDITIFYIANKNIQKKDSNKR